ncbi:MAG: helix-turn-helix domain-containing protein [Pseudonocardiaceae bacterium]
MKPSPTDNNPLPHRWRNLLPLTGLTAGQLNTLYIQAQQRLTPAPGRPWALPLAVRVLLVLIQRRTNLTTRALAALFHTSQSTVDRIIHHLVPVLAHSLQPAPDNSSHPWIIDDTLIRSARPIDHRHQQELPPQRQHRRSSSALTAAAWWSQASAGP